MVSTHEEYLVDQAGNRKAVVLPLAEWLRIKEELEELDDIRAYDEAKRHPSEPLLFEQAMADLREEKPDRGTPSLSRGEPIDSVLELYPSLEREDVYAALAYATWRAEEYDLPLRVG